MRGEDPSFVCMKERKEEEEVEDVFEEQRRRDFFKKRDAQKMDPFPLPGKLLRWIALLQWDVGFT